MRVICWRSLATLTNSSCPSLRLEKSFHAEVPLTGVGKDTDQDFALVSRPFGNLQRGVGRSTRRDAHQQALLPGDSTAHGKGLRLAHQKDLIYERAVQRFWRETGGRPHHAVRSKDPLRDVGRFRWLYGHQLHTRLLFLEKPSRSTERPASAQAGHQDIYPSLRVLPDLRPGAAVMRSGVRWVDVLADVEVLRVLGADIVEFNPRRDPLGITAMVAAKFLKEIAGRMIELN